MMLNGYDNGTSKFIDDRAINSLMEMAKEIESAMPLDFKMLNNDKSAIVIIDMINGFAKEGILSSSRVGALIPEIEKMLSLAEGVHKIFICDSHSSDSTEFQTYPSHAIEGTDESLIVDELAIHVDQHTKIIKKNSTNAMMTTQMRNYLLEHPEISNFILVGDCTDICILQCALGLKSYFNEINVTKRIIVPYSLVDTYDLDVTNHNAKLMNLFSLYNMKMNGIEIYKEISL